MRPKPKRGWRDWYQKEDWRRRRRLQLAVEPLCRRCRERGVNTPATICDHVTSHKGNFNLFRLSPLQSLCARCHSSGKRIEDLRGYREDIDGDGWPSDPRHPANKGYIPKRTL
jgi:5-methylcytosine-specific restriction enzyme A